MGEEIVLTFENLYEVLRKEKNNKDLQKLSPEFFYYVNQYLKEKKSNLEEVSRKSDLFSQKEKESLAIQLTNIKRVLNDLYDKREQKIINLAFNKAKTGSSLIDTSALNNEEKELFRKVCLVLVECRNKFFDESSQEITREILPEQPKNSNDFVKVQFLENVEAFIGRELEEYGPYSKEEITELPVELAEILINDLKAKKM